MSKFKPDRSAELAELEVQYSPSRWVRRMPAATVVANHVEVTSAGRTEHAVLPNSESERVRASVPHQTRRYGDGPRESMFEFGAERLPNDAPIYVFIHGGYWQELDKESSCFMVPPLLDAGIRVMVVGYDLAPAVKMAKIVEEVKRAGTAIMSRAEELGSSGVWFSGFSAGGHLVGVLLMSEWMDSLPPTQRQLVEGFLPMSGIFDLRPLVRTYVNAPLQMNEEEAERHSPMSMMGRKHSPLKVLVVFGQHDSPAFKTQSRDFVQKLHGYNLDATVYEVPTMDHYSLVENLCRVNYELTKHFVNMMTAGKSVMGSTPQ